VAAQEIASLLNRALILPRRKPGQLSEFVGEMGLIIEPARQRELGPINAPRSLRHGMDVLEAQDAAERFGWQSHLGREDCQEAPMAESASLRDVSHRGAKAAWPKALEGKPHDGVQTPIRRESVDQDAFEVLETLPVCGRGAQALAQLACGTVTPQGRQINMRIGELRRRDTQHRKRAGRSEVDAHHCSVLHRIDDECC
jgi:hypothetical protein